MTLKPHEFRDPGAVVADVLAQYSVEPGDALLVLVHHPSTVQEVVHVTRMHVEDLSGDSWDDGQLLGKAVQAMPIPEWDGKPPEHSVTTILARTGLAIIGSTEGEWLAAWRYSNHLMHTYSWELILLTEHGWVDWASGLGGHTPRLPMPST